MRTLHVVVFTAAGFVAISGLATAAFWALNTGRLGAGAMLTALLCALYFSLEPLATVYATRLQRPRASAPAVPQARALNRKA
jgi:hypothetical protein